MNSRKPARPDVIRVFDAVRTTHLERMREMSNGLLLYRTRRYDFDEARAAEVNAECASRFAIAWRIIQANPRVIEINEPSLVSAWPTILLCIAAAQVNNLRARSKPRVVFYAIDNFDPTSTFRGYLPFLPEKLARIVVRFVIFSVMRSTERVAFGTVGSMEMYANLLGPNWKKWVRHRMFPALGSPCACAVTEVKNPVRVAFVGSFEARKGIQEVMASWDLLQKRVPEATLSLVGKGPLLTEVERWAHDRADVSLQIDPPREEIHRTLREAHCLVLLSQPSPTWREQVGLPILEGLSHGCEIVASSETGIASWLAEHDHFVLDPRCEPSDLAHAITQALASTRSTGDILDTLPAQDSRVSADHWLTTSDDHIEAAVGRGRKC